MTRRDVKTEAARVRAARGAAQAAIGKLIGDDTQIAKGRDEQRAADRAAQPDNKEQE